MGYHYLAEITVYRNDDAVPEVSNRYGDTVSPQEAKSRELLRSYLRAQTVGELRGAVESALGILTDFYETNGDDV